MAILALSRKVGSGTREIGESVAQALNYEFVGIRKIQERMSSVGEKWEHLGKTYGENYPTFLERHNLAFAGYVALAKWIVLQFALEDNVVIVSRGSNFLLKGIPYAFRVRVTAPTEDRIERIMAREGVRRDVAKMLIERADQEMSRSISYIFGKDWDNPSDYDLVVETVTATTKQITDNLVKELIHRDSLRTEDALRALALRTKAHEIIAGILVNPKLHMPILDVQPQGDGLVLRGVADNSYTSERAEDIAKRIAGDIPIKFSIHSRKQN